MSQVQGTSNKYILYVICVMSYSVLQYWSRSSVYILHTYAVLRVLYAVHEYYTECCIPVLEYSEYHFTLHIVLNITILEYL